MRLAFLSGAISTERSSSAFHFPISAGKKVGDLTWVDYDNDGWLDLVAVGESASGAGEIRLLRNLGDAGWADVTKKVQLDALKLSQPRAVAFADLKANGSPDLVVTQDGAPPLLLQNIGANKNNWIAVDLKGLNDNKSGIGTKVELFAGALYQKFEISSASGYLSQNATPLLVGLGSQKVADAIRLLWPTGVPQDEVDLAAMKTVPVGELDRRGSSCPILFSWNGKEYEFIADMIGPGVVGHWIAPGERDVPDPDEYLKVPAKSVREKNGLLSFRFMEPMEETVYLDHVRLLAIDHPANVEVNPNERFVSNPPFPEFRVVATQNSRIPSGAWDDRGKQCSSSVGKEGPQVRYRFSRSPPSPASPSSIGSNSTSAVGTPRNLCASSWMATPITSPQPRCTQPIKPASRSSLPMSKRKTRKVIGSASLKTWASPPVSLAPWSLIFPGKSPPGTQRIRIVTNLKIYWDSIRIDQTPELREIHVNEVPLASCAARLFRLSARNSPQTRQ